jgi:hypothetical protein
MVAALLTVPLHSGSSDPIAEVRRWARRDRFLGSLGATLNG